MLQTFNFFLYSAAVFCGEFSLIFHRRKLRLREVMWLEPGHWSPRGPDRIWTQVCLTSLVLVGRFLRGCPSSSLIGQKGRRKARDGLCQQSEEGVHRRGGLPLFPGDCLDLAASPWPCHRKLKGFTLVPRRGLRSYLFRLLPYLKIPKGVT